MSRTHLSAPDVGAVEAAAVARALESGWVAPLGPEVDAFETDVAEMVARRHAIALSSGTAAIHLALETAGVRPGARVVVPTFTFGATVFPVAYLGAKPVFVDSESKGWGLDPEVLREVLRRQTSTNEPIAAVIAVDLFGETADYASICEVCAEFDVPLIEDSAEALGAKHDLGMAGSFGASSVLSFNGNKIMTTSGGGMLLTDNAEIAERVRYLATQARQPLPWYEHQEIGYNYRLSNILAALGRAQLQRLPDMIDARRGHREMYRSILGEAGITVRNDAPWGRGNGWLSIAVFQDASTPVEVRETLAQRDIETRPVWKPMHLQPVFADAERHLTGVSEDAFARGLCLPSGSAMSQEDCERVARLIVEIASDRS